MKPAPAILICLLFALLLMTGAACGVKRMPVPPKQMPVPVVADLSARLAGNTVRLSWTLPEEILQLKNATVVIYRSAVGSSATPCDDCPVIFERMESIPVPHGSASTERRIPMTYGQELNEGYNYRYKVIVKPPIGPEGADSNIVEFSY
ncbi:MAG: hypothetical protein HKM93_10390 [Desulfobacteraceae bacterium]|nr:hypothetical protein [Desulfobacteraceae bacterium]